MKTLSLIPLCSIIAATALRAPAQADAKPSPADSAASEEASDADTLRSTGITFSVDEESLLIAPENVKIPLTFVRTTATPAQDETGKTVAWEQIRTGVPITVHYTMLGEKMVATKVVVSRYMAEGGKETEATDEDGRKRVQLARMKQVKDAVSAEKTKTQPTTGGGTIMGFEQVIAVGDGNGGDVTQFVVNNSTQYVSPGGKPVPLGLVRTGGRIEVNFVENHGRKIATQIVVHSPSTSQVSSVAGTATATGSSPQNNAGSSSGTGTNSGATTSNSTGGSNTAWVDQFGNIIPGTLETGFINPPLTVLPSGRPGTPGSTSGTGAANNGTSNGGNVTGTNGTPNGTNVPGTTNPQQPVQPVQPGQPMQPGQTVQPGQPAQPGTNQPAPTSPNTNQPGSTQPSTNPQPGTRQPSTRQPSTRPATSPPASSPASPSPAPSSAPGR